MEAAEEMARMKLYLVQHGLAESKEVDPERPLTERGRADTLLMAEMAAKLELNLGEIRHSGKTRAEQTAVIFARALGLMDRVVEKPGLGPTDDVQPLATALDGGALAKAEWSLMVVGHLPYLGRLSGLLVNRDAEQPAVDFHNSGIVCLEQEEEGEWTLHWQLLPGY